MESAASRHAVSMRSVSSFSLDAAAFSSVSAGT